MHLCKPLHQSLTWDTCEHSVCNIIIRDWAASGLRSDQWALLLSSFASWAQNKYQAQRALQRNGEMLTERLMVGVKRLDVRHRSEAAALEGRELPLALHTEALPVPARLLVPRPYRVDADISAQV